ncbi:MAG: hypothetical protein JNK73_03390 [Bacteroidia bacterium]|nr:hypothetical protein [Bacteroidia bacterium]
MIKRNIREYIQIGASLRFLQDAKANQYIVGSGRITGNLKLYFNELDKLDLSVTKRASRNLKSIYDDFIKLDESAKLTNAQAHDLVENIKQVRKTLQAETEGIQAIIITDKRYTIEKLQDIRQLLDTGVFERLPDLAKYDLTECGYCICFERPTAAAFHLLRATEEILKHFHRKYIKAKPTGFMTWGNYTTALKNKSKGKKPDLTIINHLDNIRMSFRNPTQHPDKIYDIQEIQNLLGVCLDVINRMGKEL